MTTAFRGRDFAMYVADPNVSPSDYVLVAGLRTSSLTINNNPVDITTIGDGGFQNLLPDGGVQSFEFSGDGVFDNTSPGFNIVARAALDRVFLEVELRSGSGQRFRGQMVVGSFGRSGAYDNAEMFNIAMRSHGRMSVTNLS